MALNVGDIENASMSFSGGLLFGRAGGLEGSMLPASILQPHCRSEQTLDECIAIARHFALPEDSTV
jgi:hypothetical protein